MVGRMTFAIDAGHLDIRDEKIDPIVSENAYRIVAVRCEYGIVRPSTVL